MTFDPSRSDNSKTGVMLGSRIEIFPSQPLPELNTKNGSAYAAKVKTESSSDLYAIICLSGQPPRIDAVTPMRTIDNVSILRLIEGGVVSWANGASAYALVYQRPLAPRMFASLDETRTLLSEDTINHNFITPMISALVALSNAGVVHNAIHPGNIFWRLGNSTPPQIGECLSSPAGLNQPTIFETIERSMATPLGRGVGAAADDCYAFGMVLAFLVLGRNPFQGLDDATIIDLKLQRGTFAAIIGNQRLLPMHIEILRGLLADDHRQRWTATDLDLWLSGRRMTPKSSDSGRRASRHFEFAGNDYWQVSPLAKAFSENVSEAARVLETDALGKWLRRAMNDLDRASDVELVHRDLKQSGKTAHYEDQLVARVCIALDPSAPIRYRGLSMMPDGMAPLLVEAALNGNNLGVLSDIISTQLVSLWVEFQKDARAEYVTMVQQFERMKGLVERTSYGNGVERVTYELNPSLPCMSPMLLGHYVTTPKMLLPALERVASNSSHPREPMDRHIAAYLIVRDKRGEGQFDAMTMPEGAMRRSTNLLGLFADLQHRHGPDSLPRLASWLAPFIEPVVKRFFSKALRDKIQKQIKEAVTMGNISALQRLIDDPRRVDRDKQDFAAARLLYLNIQKEIAALELKLNNRESVVRGAGKPMAASISSFLAIILICAAIVRALIEGWLE